MESSAIFSLSPPSFLNPTTPNKAKAPPFNLWRLNGNRHASHSHLHCNKMFVPGFGEASPEAKAASNLHHFFTFVAVKIVAAQLEIKIDSEGCDNIGFAEQSYNPEAHKELMEFLGRNSLSDGDKFCADMMRESSNHKNLALRILEVRSAYCKSDFEWDNLRRVAIKMVDDSNTKIMRDYVVETSHET